MTFLVVSLSRLLITLIRGFLEKLASLDTTSRLDRETRLKTFVSSHHLLKLP